MTEFKFHQKIIGLQQRLKVNHALECFAKELQVKYLFMCSSWPKISEAWKVAVSITVMFYLY